MYTQEISSLQHPIVKHLVKLRQEKGYREEHESVLVPGIKLASELSPHTQIKTLLIEKDYIPPFPITAEKTFIVSPQILKKITGLQQPEPIAIEIPLPTTPLLSGVKRLLILDGISDPGNVGTLFRTAFALQWDALFLTPQTSDPWNEKALRAAKGATFKLPFRKGTIEELLTLIQTAKLHLMIADSQGNASLSPSPRGPCALVLGNESHGVCPELKQIGTCIGISIHPGCESLNVSAAGAILMDRINAT